MVHHSGRAGDHPRGSNAWDGAVWSDLRLTGTDQRCRINCKKHKDVPDGCDHHYRLVPHVVPEDLMPGCDIKERSTLVAVQGSDQDKLSANPNSMKVVLDVIRTTGGDEGLSRTQIAAFALERGVCRTSAYEAVKALAERGTIYHTGTHKRRIYVAEGSDIGPGPRR